MLVRGNVNSLTRILALALRINYYNPAVVLFTRSRRSPRGGKLPFSEGSNSEGTRLSGMSGGGTNESNNKGNVSNSTDANAAAATTTAATDSTATSSTSTTANTTVSNVSLRTNPFENFNVAMESER